MATGMPPFTKLLTTPANTPFEMKVWILAGRSLNTWVTRLILGHTSVDTVSSI